jgi:ubiquinone/menaquinone biosynthesis C-methylase UbiE
MQDPAHERLERPPELARMFDRVAGDYEARPDYPRRVFDVLVERCGLGPGTRVLEIGAGSGQATLPLLDRGAQVTVVEPGDALARRLVERTSGRSIDFIVSVFEDVEFAEASFDLAASATAFHWVDLAVGLERCARFLRDGGWLALWWTFWGEPAELVRRRSPPAKSTGPIEAPRRPPSTGTWAVTLRRWDRAMGRPRGGRPAAG